MLHVVAVDHVDLVAEVRVGEVDHEAHVITSYSIHYTKLYDALERQRSLANGGRAGAVVAQYVARRPLDSNRLTRITSYNVCYTKLLRRSPSR